MNSRSRTMLAAALAAVVAVGVPAAIAVAGPSGGGGDTAATKTVKPKAVKDKAAKPKAVKDKGRQSQQAGSKLRWKLEKEATRKERRLTRLQDSNKVQRLGDDAVSVRANISGDADRARQLALVLAQREATPAEVAELHAMRPEVYNRIISQIRLVRGLIARLDAAPPGTLGAVPVDVATLEALLTQLSGYDAGTPRSQLKEHQVQIAGAKEALDATYGDMD